MDKAAPLSFDSGSALLCNKISQVSAKKKQLLAMLAVMQIQMDCNPCPD